MNWITTKMPDAHWLTEARQRGTQIVVITCEYSATANKGDEVHRDAARAPTPALALGLAAGDPRARSSTTRDFVRRNTDLPLLVRMDTLELLRADDAARRRQRRPSSRTDVRAAARRARSRPPPIAARHAARPRGAARGVGRLRGLGRARRRRPRSVTRDEVGERFDGARPRPGARGRVRGRRWPTAARSRCGRSSTWCGSTCARTSTPRPTSRITWAPEAGDRLAGARDREEPRARRSSRSAWAQPVLQQRPEGPRRLPGGGAHAQRRLPGRQRRLLRRQLPLTLFGGMPQWAAEDPFDLAARSRRSPPTPATSPASSRPTTSTTATRRCARATKLFTGKTHVPTPTKAMFLSNSNSILGNTKWHFDVVHNTLPKVECVAFSDWWWTGSCEYADIVYGVDSWAEAKVPDMTASCTNPFLQVFPRTPLPRLFDTAARRGDRRRRRQGARQAHRGRALRRRLEVRRTRTSPRSTSSASSTRARTARGLPLRGPRAKLRRRASPP